MVKLVSFQNCLLVIYITLFINVSKGSIFDYFPIGKYFTYDNSNNNKELTNELISQSVPYEIEVTDEKFIEQAAKFTGVSLSDLDKCQHRVVFKLQTECHKLNDEELAKLAVKLLNCQSSIEGRTTYPCTDQMPIRDCTSSMDPDTWNSYLLMSNRARAVCYSIRQAQFRGLTEITVNKLMSTAHEQLNVMSRLKEGQSRIEEATSETFETVVKGNQVIKEQQNDLQKAQFHGQLVLEDNIRRLADEKQLILEGHERLAKMTKDIKARLDEAAEQLDTYTNERKNNHEEILKDLIEIQKQVKTIFFRIEKSSQLMLERSMLNSKQYEATLSRLAQVNSTVHVLVDVVSSTRAILEEKLKWLADALGGTDNAVERLYLLISHITYLLLAMVACSFLQVHIYSRIALLLLVPLNLFVGIQQGTQNALDFLGLTLATVSFIVVQTVCQLSLLFWNERSNKKNPKQLTNHVSSGIHENEIRQKEQNDEIDSDSCNTSTHANDTLSKSFSFRNKYTYNSDNHLNVGDLNDFTDFTPPLSRLSRSRSKTPATSDVGRHKCCALTRMGTPCKSTALSGRDFCYRHQSGTSVVME